MHERRGGEAKRNGSTLGGGCDLAQAVLGVARGLFAFRSSNLQSSPQQCSRRRAKKLAERAYRNVAPKAHHRARQQMTGILSAEQPLLISIMARVPSSSFYWYQGLTVDSELDLGSP
jgi:hypothetical protein